MQNYFAFITLERSSNDQSQSPLFSSSVAEGGDSTSQKSAPYTVEESANICQMDIRWGFF